MSDTTNAKIDFGIKIQGDFVFIKICCVHTKTANKTIKVFIVFKRSTQVDIISTFHDFCDHLFGDAGIKSHQHGFISIVDVDAFTAKNGDIGNKNLVKLVFHHFYHMQLVDGFERLVRGYVLALHIAVMRSFIAPHQTVFISVDPIGDVIE